ncbi:hypothetical protein ACFZCP_45290 [Streptomyces sp. NPDC007971]|uniref:hypothetical protein n=1 Tax=Streptomyces sp. NPDC007971 TaxID=3364799 RepID=UPI0036E127F6
MLGLLSLTTKPQVSTTLSVKLREPYPVAPKPGKPLQEVRVVRFAADGAREAVRILRANIVAG